MFFCGIDKYFDKFTKWKKLGEETKIIDITLNIKCKKILRTYLKDNKEEKTPKEYLTELCNNKIEEIKNNLKEKKLD